MKSKKIKYRVTPYENISAKNKNEIGFIDTHGNFYYVRKANTHNGSHTAIANHILEIYNDQCNDIYLSCEKLCKKYNFVIVIDEFLDDKVSIRYFNEPTKRQMNVINMLYDNYVMFCEKNNFKQIMR